VDLGPIPLTGGRYTLNWAVSHTDKKRTIFSAVASCVLEVQSNFVSTAFVELGV
jgi:hypothetical protein